MKKFKLMQIIPSFRSGGVEQGTLDVANNLSSLKIKNYICSNGGSMLSHLNEKYIDHITLPVHSKNFFMKPLVARKINSIINKNQINILHFRSRAPAWLLPFINKKNIKTISTFHNVYGSENFLKKIYNLQLSKVDKIIAISNYVRDEIIKKYNLNSDKITVINRGIDTDFYDNNLENDKDFINFLNEYNIDLNKKIILFPGRLTQWKGQIEFLEVIEYFQKYPIIFYFVGDDKNKSYLYDLNKNIGQKKLQKNCKILGHLNQEKLRMMYRCSNLVISAPLKPEGFGRSISESLAMKKIILAYNFGGAKDQLRSLDNIYKINNQNISQIIFRINEVLNLNNEQIENMGNIARKHVINNFSKKLMLNAYLNIYKGI